MDSIQAARAERAFLETEIRELEEHVHIARSAARRHTLWAVLGVSPSAAIPLLLSAHEMGMAMIVAFSAFVTGVESWRAIQARMDVMELRERLLALSTMDPTSAVQSSESAPTSPHPHEDSTETPDL